MEIDYEALKKTLKDLYDNQDGNMSYRIYDAIEEYLKTDDINALFKERELFFKIFPYQIAYTYGYYSGGKYLPNIFADNGEENNANEVQ